MVSARGEQQRFAGIGNQSTDPFGGQFGVGEFLRPALAADHDPVGIIAVRGVYRADGILESSVVETILVETIIVHAARVEPSDLPG